MAEIMWTKDGQGQFDFDYLLNLTNQDFVDVIAKFIDKDYVKQVKVIKKDITNYVEVIIVNRHSVRTFVYTGTSVNLDYESTSLSIDDLMWALEVMQRD